MLPVGTLYEENFGNLLNYYAIESIIIHIEGGWH